MSKKILKEGPTPQYLEHHAKRGKELIHSLPPVQALRIVAYVGRLVISRDSRLQPTYPQLQRPKGVLESIRQHWEMAEALRQNRAEIIPDFPEDDSPDIYADRLCFSCDNLKPTMREKSGRQRGRCYSMNHPPTPLREIITNRISWARYDRVMRTQRGSSLGSKKRPK